MEHTQPVHEYAHPQDYKRGRLYVAMLQIAGLFNQLPGGRDAVLVGMAVAYGAIEGMPMNVSTIANMVDMDRKAVRRLLGILVEHGFLNKRTGERGWTVYERNTCEENQQRIAHLIDEIYRVLKTQLFDICAADEDGQ